jgi:hypothetical protein
MAGAIRLDDPTDEQIDTLCTQLAVWLKRARRIPNVTIEVRDLQATIDLPADVAFAPAPVRVIDREHEQRSVIIDINGGVRGQDWFDYLKARR